MRAALRPSNVAYRTEFSGGIVFELDIKHDEEEHSLERKVHRIEQINTMASVSMLVGLVALARQMVSGEITALLLN
jgi:hypothetical protein